MKVKQPKAILKCSFCGKVFKRTISKNTVEVRCPSCREYDVEVIGIEKEHK
jgi:phage FluMu protein Com